jgi:hypothetical protein
MAVEVLSHQARAHAKRSGEPFEDALKSVLKTEAGRQLGKLRDGPHRGETAAQWQGDLLRERRRERVEAARKQFRLMQDELQELELQKKDQPRLIR